MGDWLAASHTAKGEGARELSWSLLARKLLAAVEVDSVSRAVQVNAWSMEYGKSGGKAKSSTKGGEMEPLFRPTPHGLGLSGHGRPALRRHKHQHLSGTLSALDATALLWQTRACALGT